MKFFLLAALMIFGSSHLAHADDEISCATDNECIKAKVEAGEAQFKKNRKQEAREAKKQKSHKPADDSYVPCAGDSSADGCQRGKLDAIDHSNGENVDD
jgi:hypothetical protein